MSVELTEDERAQVDADIAADKLVSDADLAEYVATTSVADLAKEVGTDTILAKRIYAAEIAEGGKNRKGLIEGLAKLIDPDAPAEKPSKPSKGDKIVTTQHNGAKVCPYTGHSTLGEKCGLCGAEMTEGESVKCGRA